MCKSHSPTWGRGAGFVIAGALGGVSPLVHSFVHCAVPLAYAGGSEALHPHATSSSELGHGIRSGFWALLLAHSWHRSYWSLIPPRRIGVCNRKVASARYSAPAGTAPQRPKLPAAACRKVVSSELHFDSEQGTGARLRGWVSQTAQDPRAFRLFSWLTCALSTCAYGCARHG